MLNKRSESGHPCLVHNPKGNACSCHLLSIMMLAVDCHIWCLFCLSTSPLIPLCWGSLSQIGAGFYQMLFLHLLIWSCFSLILFMWFITFINLWMLHQPWIPRINPTWSWCMTFLMYCCIKFANIFLRILASMFIRDIAIVFREEEEI